MPNVTLEKQESLYLRNKLCEIFQNEAKQKITINSVRANYIGLSEEITKSTKGKSFDNFRFSKDFEATDAQLQRLFFVEALTFRDDFVNACYCYVFKQTRNAFFKATENETLVNSWRVTEGGASIATDTKEDETLFNLTKTKPESTSPILNTPRARNWTKIMLFASLFVIAGLTTALLMTRHKLHKTLLWYKPLPIEEEIELKDDLTFVNTPIFRENIRNLVRPLLQGHEDLVAKKGIKPDNNIIEWYRAKKGNYHFCFYGQGYRFCMDRCNWTGFTKEETPSGGFMTGVEDSVYTLFSKYANVLLGDKLKDSIYLNTLFNIPIKDYKAVLLYVGYKADTSNFLSRELMVRYPSYDVDFIAAGKGYVMTSRPWWRDATDTIRRQKFSWTDSVDNHAFLIGLSTPYPTIRRKSPNQRCLWVEIPLKPPTVMFLGIDLLKND
jgi:hypothetical protein